MEKIFQIRLKKLLNFHYKNFGEIEMVLEYLLDNSLFEDMSKSEFLNFKSVFEDFYKGKELTKKEQNILCLENEYFNVNTESLEDTEKRVLKWLRIEYLFWKHEEYQLVIGHSNSLRGLVKFLEKINDKDIENLSIPTGKPILFELNGFQLNQKKILTLSDLEPNLDDWKYKIIENSVSSDKIFKDKNFCNIKDISFNNL